MPSDAAPQLEPGNRSRTRAAASASATVAPSAARSVDHLLARRAAPRRPRRAASSRRRPSRPARSTKRSTSVSTIWPKTGPSERLERVRSTARSRAASSTRQPSSPSDLKRHSPSKLSNGPSTNSSVIAPGRLLAVARREVRLEAVVVDVDARARDRGRVRSEHRASAGTTAGTPDSARRRRPARTSLSHGCGHDHGLAHGGHGVERYNTAMSIVDNRKAFHDYFIEERYEAGLVLGGLGGQGDPRRARQPQGSLRHPEERGAVHHRHAHQRAAHRLDARESRPHAHAQAAAATPTRSPSSSARWSSAATRWCRSTCTTPRAA